MIRRRKKIDIKKDGGRANSNVLAGGTGVRWMGEVFCPLLLTKETTGEVGEGAERGVRGQVWTVKWPEPSEWLTRVYVSSSRAMRSHMLLSRFWLEEGYNYVCKYFFFLLTDTTFRLLSFFSYSFVKVDARDVPDIVLFYRDHDIAGFQWTSGCIFGSSLGIRTITAWISNGMKM